jgi:hypothetical protein
VTFTPYLQPGEYAAYGIPDANAAQVAAASRQVNAYLGRPEGLIWTPDANGSPCCMANLDPIRSFTVAVGAGSNVTVTVPHAAFGNHTVGKVVVLDRANAEQIEACVVTAASGDTLTLATVQFDHIPATMDFGLTVVEETKLRAASRVVYLAKAPIAQILCGFSRVGSGTLPRQITDAWPGSLPLAPTNGTLVPLGWTAMDTTQWDTDSNTGEVTILPFPLPSTRLDVRVSYVAGWASDDLPGGIKQAVANMTRAAIDTPFSGNLKLVKAGDATLERFGPGTVDADTRSLLQPYTLVRIG